MKNFFIISLLITIPYQAFAGINDMENACESIPGMYECKSMNSSSFWVVISNSSLNHNYQSYGSMLCDGGKRNFNVNKGYSITFWNRNGGELYKYRCY
jgi:hypothetical protein